MGIERTNFYVKIERIEEVNDCFDGTSFTINEVDDALVINQGITEEKDKQLDKKKKDLAESNSECAEIGMQITSEKQVQNNREKAYNDFLLGGGKAESKEGQKLAASAMDIIQKVLIERLDQEKRNCEIDYSTMINKKEYAEGTRKTTLANLLNEKECVKKNIDKYTGFIADLRAIDKSNGVNYAQATQQKNLFYFKSIVPSILSCRGDVRGMDGTRAREAQEKLKEMIQRKKNR
jgi:hypothetical protein